MCFHSLEYREERERFPADYKWGIWRSFFFFFTWLFPRHTECRRSPLIYQSVLLKSCFVGEGILAPVFCPNWVNEEHRYRYIFITYEMMLIKGNKRVWDIVSFPFLFRLPSETVEAEPVTTMFLSAVPGAAAAGMGGSKEGWRVSRALWFQTVTWASLNSSSCSNHSGRMRASFLLFLGPTPGWQL